MKKFIPTLVLVVLCIGGFLYAKSHSFFKEKDPNADKQLVTVQAADVQGISIASIGDPVELSKKDSGWQMTKPSAYPVDKFAPDSWLGAFGALTYESKIDDNPGDLAEFGLDKPARQFQITFKDGSVKKLLIGKSLPVAGNSYAKLDDAPAVYEVPDQTLQSLDKQPLDFLDKNAFSYQYDKLKSLGVEWKGDKWLLEKAEADKTVYETKWKMGSLELKPADGTGVLDKLMYATTEQMVKPAADVKMDAPELKVEIKEEDNGKETASTYSGKIDKDNIWIVKQGGAWAYSLPMAVIQDLFDKGKNPVTPDPSASPSPSASAAPAK